MNHKSYVLITAARNEEAYIENTLKAVAAQTRLPAAWVIVSDGSTDRTDDIVRDYAMRYGFIRLVRIDEAKERAFSNQAVASNRAYETIKGMQFDFVGFLDADVSFAPDYYETLLQRLEANPRLGITGGVIVEEAKGCVRPRQHNSLHEVAGAIQFLRRQCHEDIGGLIPLRWGGHDAVANVMARRFAWDVHTFPDLEVMHHRPTGTAGATATRARFREGMQDYFMGYLFLFEAAKCIRRISEPPYVIGSIMRLCGYVWPAISGRRQAVPRGFVTYLRHEQLRRLMGVKQQRSNSI